MKTKTAPEGQLSSENDSDFISKLAERAGMKSPLL